MMMSSTKPLTSSEEDPTSTTTSTPRRLQRGLIPTTTKSTTTIKHQDGTTRTITTEATPPIVDYPYWGSPQACTILDLVKVFSKEETVLLDSPDYIAISKPADLRMDGPYPANVHKLLWYWYPPPSLAPLLLEEEKGDDNDSDDIPTSRFFTRLQEIKKCNMLEDNPFRLCHQLDYATSGVLLLAKNKEAAARAHRSFQERRTIKVYLALVHGHLHQKDQLLQYPKLDMTYEELKQGLVDLELQQRRDQIRKQRKSDTFLGYAPPFQMYQKWMSKRKRKYRKDEDERTAEMCYEIEQRLLKDIDEKLTDEERETIRNSSWPALKKRHPLLRKLFKIASDEYNAKVRDQLTKLQQEQDQQKNKVDFSKLPHLFRLNGSSDDTFYIHAGLVQQKDSFAMKIQGPDDNPKDFLLSVTKCTVLERTKWTGQDADDGDPSVSKNIAKVRLELLTGRRHQLRCHMLIAESPIVGDVTYSKQEHLSSILCPRMCLHAHKLALPDCSLDITAPDPFDALLLSLSGTG